MLFNVLKVRAAGNLKSGDRRATERQTSREHEQLLDMRTLPSYSRFLALPPGPQKTMALAALRAEAELRELEFPKYWNDKFPRRPISQSSSWVGDVDYDPYSQLMTVDMNGKKYSYAGKSPDEVSRFLNSDSLGKYLNRK